MYYIVRVYDNSTYVRDFWTLDAAADFMAGLDAYCELYFGGLAARNTWAATGSVEASIQTSDCVDRKNSLIWCSKQGKLGLILSTKRNQPFHEQRGNDDGEKLWLCAMLPQ